MEQKIGEIKTTVVCLQKWVKMRNRWKFSSRFTSHFDIKPTKSPIRHCCNFHVYFFSFCWSLEPQTLTQKRRLRRDNPALENTVHELQIGIYENYGKQLLRYLKKIFRRQ